MDTGEQVRAPVCGFDSTANHAEKGEPRVTEKGEGSLQEVRLGKRDVGSRRAIVNLHIL
jgi:hypothetical protein